MKETLTKFDTTLTALLGQMANVKEDIKKVSLKVTALEIKHEIKRILTLHYAAKRDLRTLEHQMGQMTQGMKTVDAFHTAVNNHFALIVRSLKNGDQIPEITSILLESYRDRALDVFIRSLREDISKLLIIREPKTLPEAYAICLELQNVNSKVHVSYNNRFPSPHQAYRPLFVPRYPWEF